MDYHNKKGKTLYNIYYYNDGNGESPVLDYIESLAKKSDKDSRLKYNKIRSYIKLLSERGLQAGEPYIKHLDGEIWEIRPLRDRILFAAWDDDTKGFVLLHQFMKQTQKTPRREIDIAKNRWKELKDNNNE